MREVGITHQNDIAEGFESIPTLHSKSAFTCYIPLRLHTTDFLANRLYNTARAAHQKDLLFTPVRQNGSNRASDTLSGYTQVCHYYELYLWNNLIHNNSAKSLPTPGISDRYTINNINQISHGSDLQPNCNSRIAIQSRANTDCKDNIDVNTYMLKTSGIRTFQSLILSCLVMRYYNFTFTIYEAISVRQTYQMNHGFVGKTGYSSSFRDYKGCDNGNESK